MGMDGAFLRSGLDRENHENPTGGGGVDDFISWVAAGLQICSDDARPQLLRNVRTMNRDRRYQKHVLAGAAFGALALGTPAAAADLPVKAPVPYVSTAYDWNGWYVGAHVGVVRGSSNWSAMPPGAGVPGLSGAFGLPFNFDFMAGTGSYAVGLQGGYNYVSPSHLMLGFETDVSAPNSDVVVPYSVRG